MLNLNSEAVRAHIFDGAFGLERETLRVTADGYMAHTPHPFGDDPHIVKDFCENQTEINTGVHRTARGVINELRAHTERVYRTLGSRGEYLWMFSNPPYIKSAADIPVALYDGAQKGKQSYRLYLAEKYGKYKMTLSGIHVNYSFDDALLEADFKLSPYKDFTEYKNRLYLSLAQAFTAHGWLINLLLSASPLRDGSYSDPARLGVDELSGDASVRCSFHGYWNSFTPVLDYRDILSYAESIQKYIDSGMLNSAGELYYPVRLKPRGTNRLNALVQNGVNHIELRNVDLNPFASEGIDERDLRFIELFLLWLAAAESKALSQQEQSFAIQNFKSAARMDIDRESIRLLSGRTVSVRNAGIGILSDMHRFFCSDDFTEEVKKDAAALIDCQLTKLSTPGSRYAERVVREFGGGFVRKGMEYICMTRQHNE